MSLDLRGATRDLRAAEDRLDTTPRGATTLDTKQRGFDGNPATTEDLREWASTVSIFRRSSDFRLRRSSDDFGNRDDLEQQA